MQEHEVRELFERAREAMDPALEYEDRHQDYLVEFPQSGERLDRDGLRRLQEIFPGGTPPKIELRRVTGGGDVWFGESLIHYADGTAPTASAGSSSARQDVARDPLLGRAVRGPGVAAGWSRPVVEEPVAGCRLARQGAVVGGEVGARVLGGLARCQATERARASCGSVSVQPSRSRALAESTRRCWGMVPRALRSSGRARRGPGPARPRSPWPPGRGGPSGPSTRSRPRPG